MYMSTRLLESPSRIPSPSRLIDKQEINDTIHNHYGSFEALYAEVLRGLIDILKHISNYLKCLAQFKAFVLINLRFHTRLPAEFGHHFL